MSKLSAIGESTTLRVADCARRMEAEGQRIFKLQTGDPDFKTPIPIVEAACRALREGNTHYSNTRGLPKLREAISQALETRRNVHVNPETEVLVTHGAVHGIYCVISALVEQGDEVLIVDPSWMPYASATRIAGGTPIQVPSTAKNGYALPLEEMAQHIGPRTRLVIVNSPNNPTGHVISPEEWLGLEELLATNQRVMLLSDEVYSELIYDENIQNSPASRPGLWERTITVDSFSKTYAMTGWRIGYLAAPASVIKEVLKVSQYSITSLAPFAQRGALEALLNVDVQAEVNRMKATYNSRRKMVAGLLENIDEVGYTLPQGAFYFMLDITSSRMDAASFAERLLEEAAVAVVPGTGFGVSGEGSIRITFAVGENVLEEGLCRIKKWLQRLHAQRGDE